MQRLKEFSQEQQEDLAKRQEKLQQVHDHLFENSKSMLEAQVSPLNLNNFSNAAEARSHKTIFF